MDKNKFPQGLRTMLEMAPNVSGGEKQRIAIARAILADPPILLLDEATSALDEDNQEKVQQALDKLMKGRTTLVIAHRLSTIKNSNKFVSFDNGVVFEEGTHNDLLKKDGSLYRRLWNKQCSTVCDANESKEDEEDHDNDIDIEDEGEESIEPLLGGMNPPLSAITLVEKMKAKIDKILSTDSNKKELQSLITRLETQVKILQFDHLGR